MAAQDVSVLSKESAQGPLQPACRGLEGPGGHTSVQGLGEANTGSEDGGSAVGQAVPGTGSSEGGSPPGEVVGKGLSPVNE